VEQRIASLLLMLASKLGTELPFTRQEIAEMAGTTTETAIRVLSRLAKVISWLHGVAVSHPR